MYGVQHHFQHYFSYATADSALSHTFLEFLLPVLSTKFFQSRWLLSYITIIETMESSDRGQNPVA